jgi:GT2 family glycosyltransferase
VEPTVYVPNLNGGARLLRTVETLSRQTREARVVVVDNGSTDDSISRVRAEAPETRILALGANYGFGPALNRAVRAYPSSILLFVNNDVECEPDYVAAMLDALGTGTGMVAGVLLQHTRPDVIDSAGVVADETLLAFDYLHGQPVGALADAPAPLSPTGGAALFRADAFEAVRGFDDRIFAYLEDVDLGLRLRASGVRCGFARHARALHRHSATLGSGSARKNWLMGWSRGYLLRRYGVLGHPRRALRALAAEAVIVAGQAAIDHTLTGLRGRMLGWRAGASLPRNPIPEPDLIEISLREALARRAARRPLSPRRRRPG